MLKIYKTICLVMVLGFYSNAIAQTCDGLTRLTENTGTFEDGSGDSDYANGLECKWVVKPSGGGPIRIIFNSFNTESGFSYLAHTNRIS